MTVAMLPCIYGSVKASISIFRMLSTCNMPLARKLAVLALDLLDVLTLKKVSLIGKFKSTVVRDCIVSICGRVFRIPDFRSLVILLPEYEKELLDCVDDEGKYDILIDVGAHIGKYAIQLKDMYKRAYLFEPNPITFHYLRQNIALNGLEGKCILYNLALLDKDGVAKLHYNRFRLDTSIVGDYGNTTVRTAKLDDIVRVEGKRILIKIDVEGREYEVLKGAIELLRRNNVLLLIEITSNRARIHALLRKLGMRLVYSKFTYSYFDRIRIWRECWRNY